MSLSRWLTKRVRSGFLESLTKPGTHEIEISALYGGRMAPTTGKKLNCQLTVMGFTNRCGSNLLADYLVQTGRFGGFGEALNPPVVSTLSRNEGLQSLPEYMATLADKQKCGPSKDLGVKASADQLAMLIRHGIPQMFEGFRVIHVWRQDLLSQAVSFAIANQTKRWTSRQKAPSFDASGMKLDLEQIEHMMRAIQLSNNRISAIASLMNFAAASLTYEELTADPGATVRRICSVIGVHLGPWQPQLPKIEKQADALNDRLVAEYRALAIERLTRR